MISVAERSALITRLRYPHRVRLAPRNSTRLLYSEEREFMYLPQREMALSAPGDSTRLVYSGDREVMHLPQREMALSETMEIVRL